MKSRYTIGSRGSRLALWQAEWVKTTLEAVGPSVEIEIKIITTSGDSMKDAPLSIIGGQGVFIKELEEALLNSTIDLAVHSLKDLPTTLPDELCLAAITEREDARDALVLRAGAETASLSELDPQAIVGTSSPRRLAQLKHLSPGRVVKELRGNVDTRLRKLDEKLYDALILASAGLKRLGRADRISAYLDPAEMLPAVGQGALGVETRGNDAETISFVQALNHPATSAACTAERALLRALGGGCQLPIAGHATVETDSIRLDGLVVSLDGKMMIRETIEGLTRDATELGQTLANRLITKGAGSLLQAAGAST